MDLDAYFHRIGYAGPRTTDLATLTGIVRAHVGAIAFENIDQQLGRRVSSDPAAIFRKLVTMRRGGWCYEQNGLLAMALEALGYRLTRVAGGVMRVRSGDATIGNHLALIVHLADGPWLADVGFGGSQAAPIPLAEGGHRHAPYDLTLRRLEDGLWRFEESDGGNPFSFDFAAEPADPARLSWHEANFQDDANSMFLLNLVVQRRLGEDAHVTLRGRTVVWNGQDGERKRLLGSADELVAAVRDEFGLDVPEIASIWPKVAARHEALFGQTA
jgi:N-hydroxyarylamine O-acetyltransferase